MPINYIACLQRQRENGRVYSFILPDQAPFEESNQVLLEMAQEVLAIKKEREEAIEKAKLEQEISDSKEESISA